MVLFTFHIEKSHIENLDITAKVKQKVYFTLLHILLHINLKLSGSYFLGKIKVLYLIFSFCRTAPFKRSEIHVPVLPN